ncbi:MAG: phosphomannomutase/phosphoglucomutase [Xanthomonadales bacterium]|nr:phosphomannomutase/phosphoglucomutase [Xanthomonadales bacterium]
MPEPKALLATILGLLLLSAGLLFIKQGYDAWRAEARRGSLAASANAIAARSSELVAGMQAALARVCTDAGFLQIFREGLVAGDLTQAERRLRAGLPDVQAIRLLPAPALEAIGVDAADFGFARMEMLLETERTHQAAAAQVHKDTAGDALRLVLSQPVIDGQTMIGHVLAEFSFEPISAIASDNRNSAGGLDMVQGDVRRAPYVLMRLGTDRMGLDPQQVSIGGTRLRLAYNVPDPFVLFGPRDAISGLAWGVFSLAVGLALVAFRAQMERLLTVRSRRVAEVAPTLNEQLAQDRAAAKDREAAKADAAAAAEVAAQEPDEENLTSWEVEAPPPPPRRVPTPQRQAVARSIFRAYDIRGVVGETLTEDVAQLIGMAIGSEIREKGLNEVVVGRDGRLSGPSLAAALIEGLRATGCDVVDIGAAPTPLLYFACYHLKAGSGVMVTGSHNPPDYNGFKIVIGGETVAEERIQGLYARIAEDRFETGAPGGVQQIDVSEDYIERISSDLQMEMPLKVVVDAGNGIAGAIAPKLLEEIGCEVTALHCEVDGTFPNHHPDPSVPANLQDLIMAVKQVGADIGVAFDGDGDRLGVVTPAGEIIYPDRLLMLFARDVLLRNPGATIIYDVKCTGKLAPIILANGGSPVMWKTGHSLIKRRMRELKAALAGEMSGHFFFQERWYGFDDGLYSACRLLEILASSGLEADDLFAELPKGHSTPELKIEFAEGEHYRFIQRFVDKASFNGARLTTIDGLRADWDDGWGLVRASNTTPSLVLRFDADDEYALERIKQLFREQLLKLDAQLRLPF